MNDGQACCSCLTVKYDPEEVEIYVEEFRRTMPGLRERWTCAAGCGSHFIRKTAADILRERLEAAQGNWSREVAELGEQIERLQAEVRTLEQKRVDLNVEIGERDAHLESLQNRFAQCTGENADELDRLRGKERSAFEAGFKTRSSDMEWAWQQYRCKDDTDFRAVSTKNNSQLKDYDGPEDDIPDMWDLTEKESG